MSYLHLTTSVELRWYSEVNLGIKHSASPSSRRFYGRKI